MNGGVGVLFFAFPLLELWIKKRATVAHRPAHNKVKGKAASQALFKSHPPGVVLPSHWLAGTCPNKGAKQAAAQRQVHEVHVAKQLAWGPCLSTLLSWKPAACRAWGVERLQQLSSALAAWMPEAEGRSQEPRLLSSAPCAVRVHHFFVLFADCTS